MPLKALLSCCLAVAITAVGSGASAPVTKPKRTVTPRSTTGYSLLRGLSLRDRIAQLIIVRGYGDYPPSTNAEYRNFRHWIHDLHVGGFIVAGRIRNGNVIGAAPFEMAAFINHAQRLARTPLLVGSDFERGASMRVADTTKFPYMMAFGAAHDLDATRQLGAATAREARTLGVNWVFAPDADVNNNPDNPIINIRSFGEDPAAVAAEVSAFIEGAHSDPRNYVLLSAKHFPGHGDTAQDSHLQLPTVNASKERMESLELIPFRAAIEHGVDSIMTAHLAVPAFEPQQIPATISHNILTGLLREELAFKGLVVTDALEMQGIAALYSQGEIAVRAVEAGADVLLMPSDPEACIRALLAAVKSGRISRQRIDASAAKVMAAKQKVGILRSRFVNLDRISDDLDSQSVDDLAQQVADRAITLVKDEKHLFPMPTTATASLSEPKVQGNEGGPCLVVMTEAEFSSHGEVLARTLEHQVPMLKTYIVSSHSPADLLKDVATDAGACKQSYVAVFVTVAANRGSVSLKGGLNDFLKNLLQGPAPVALISLGNPYLLRDFPNVSSYAATFSPAITSEVAVARAILGEIPITGKLPVSIPGVAKTGDGLDVPARASSASTTNGTQCCR